MLADAVDAVIRLILSTNETDARPLLVVDDLGVPQCSQDIAGLWKLARSMWRAGSRVLVTCREVSEWPSEYLKECVLVGPADLALTSCEAEDYLMHVGLRALHGMSEEIRVASDGHPAFFAVLSSQASAHGLAAAGVIRTPTLEAWLGSAVRQLKTEELRALARAALLRNGSDSDLALLGISDPVNALDGIGSTVPLAGCSRAIDGGRTFRIHQLLEDYLTDRSAQGDLATGDGVLEDAVTLLSGRGEYARVIELLCRQGASDQILAWLEEYGERALAEGHYLSLDRLIESISVAALMARPNLLLTWAGVCSLAGRTEDAIAKCRAARTLAEHASDLDVRYRAIAQCATYASRANRIEEAEELAAEILAAAPGQVPDVVVAEALLCQAHNAMTRGRYDRAQEVFRAATETAHLVPNAAHVKRSADMALAMMPAIAQGDHMTSLRRLAPAILDGQRERLTSRVMAKGNVGLCLCELGRLARSRQLLESALEESQSAGLDEYSGGYLAVLGCVRAGMGESQLGIDLMREGIALSHHAGDEFGADASRLYMSTTLRAIGESTESLIVAERAFERLCLADAYDFRRFAALEVSATLLALGDSSTAGTWIDIVEEEDGFLRNRSHAFRAAMILAEIDRRDGRCSEAISRIRDKSEYLLSENANWQAAMYCRAFPGLLGILAAAVTPRKLPSHLLKMIPADDAERALTEAEPVLESTAWRHLGDRLIGEAEMGRRLAQGGVLPCYVRLFGGLEVSVGGRVVHDRDWKKRKARTLFAMLVTKRGHDVPRDQVIDHLWPDMDAERARNNFYVAWSIMKSVLGGTSGRGEPCPYVESAGGVCRTIRDAVRSDTDEFEEALAFARAAESDPDRHAPLAWYERIVNVYRGDLLPGDVYDDWFVGAREHYRSEYVDAMLRASELLSDAGEAGNALVYLRKAIQTDPLREDLYQRALRCQIEAGQRSSAIDTYLQCKDRLSEELGLDPSAETRALYDRILAMEDGPIPTSLDSPQSRTGADGT